MYIPLQKGIRLNKISGKGGRENRRSNFINYKPKNIKLSFQFSFTNNECAKPLNHRDALFVIIIIIIFIRGPSTVRVSQQPTSFPFHSFLFLPFISKVILPFCPSPPPPPRLSFAYSLPIPPPPFSMEEEEETVSGSSSPSIPFPRLSNHRSTQVERDIPSSLNHLSLPPLLFPFLCPFPLPSPPSATYNPSLPPPPRFFLHLLPFSLSLFPSLAQSFLFSERRQGPD